MNTFLQICTAVFCLSMLSLHLTKRNANEVWLYALQSLAITALIGVSLWEHWSLSLLAVALATLLVKAILAPAFFLRLVKRHELTLSARTHASGPVTLVILLLLLVLASSDIFAPLTNLVPQNHTYLVLSLAVLFASLFLMTNRKGVLSQAVGILSLENSIVAFAFFANLEQSQMLELGIMFDVCVWLIIANIFVAMIYKHFQSIDVTAMKHLKG